MATHYDQIRNTFPVYSKFINSNLKSGRTVVQMKTSQENRTNTSLYSDPAAAWLLSVAAGSARPADGRTPSG